jgi:hypothetical protein
MRIDLLFPPIRTQPRLYLINACRSSGFLSRRTFQAVEEAPPGALADVISSLLPGVPPEKQQEVLHTVDVNVRLAVVTELVRQKVRFRMT